MKTITLTDEAYHRLKEWKASDKESFSSVVMRTVPEKGTLGQMLDDVAQLGPISAGQLKVMEETVQWGRDPRNSKDPWTT